MKRFLSLLLLPFVAACDPLNVNGDFGNGSDESLNGAMSGDYSESRVNSLESPQNGSLIYAGPKYYIGVPYKIEDIQYTPSEDYSYNQTGMAGIVPIDLNGFVTPNGEKFDTNAMIATSKVLPLPSIVKVTNLDTGQSAVLRVNNRGPLVNSRLMDVSLAAARKLGMTGQTKVQIQVLSDESVRVKNLTLGTGMGETMPDPDVQPMVESASGPYTVQVGAYYSMDSANAIARRIDHIGNTSIVEESGMYKVRLKGLSADAARQAIQRLRSEENMVPGLLKDGRWVNADSI